jgi:hypothetical protein
LTKINGDDTNCPIEFQSHCPYYEIEKVRLSIGLIALLDDVAAIAKVAAASLDDVVTQAAKAGVKAAGVVVDDAAVTPRYVPTRAVAVQMSAPDPKSRRASHQLTIG